MDLVGFEFFLIKFHAHQTLPLVMLYAPLIFYLPSPKLGYKWLLCYTVNFKTLLKLYSMDQQ